MQICKYAIVAMAAVALTLTCAAQNGGAPGGGAPGGGGAPAAGGGAAGGGGGMGNMVTMKVDKFIAEVNRNGKITKEEWKAAGLQDFVFSFVDSKKQGYIDKAELEATKFLRQWILINLAN